MGSAKQLKKAKKEGLDTLVKRRMMGLAVLIALSVIFLPLILDGSGTEKELTRIEPLELEPEHEFMEEITLPDLPSAVVIDFVSDNVQQPKEDEVVQQAAVFRQQIMEPPKPTLKVVKPVLAQTALAPAVVAQALVKQPVAISKASLETQSQPIGQRIVAQSFLIQTASFKDKINALSLRSELKKAGFPVTVKVGEVNRTSVFRVYVGPSKDRAAASQLQKRVEQTFNRKTFLVAE